MEDQNPIASNHFMTAQESVFVAGTPDITPQTEAEWFKPQGLLLNRPYTLAEIVRAREEAGLVRNPVMGDQLRRSGVTSAEGMYAVPLEAIDLETGQTLKDPKALIGGVWDEENHKLVGGVDVTEHVNKGIEEWGLDVPYREGKRTLESEGGNGNPER